MPCGPVQLLPLGKGRGTRDEGFLNVVCLRLQLVDLFAPEVAVWRLDVQQRRNLSALRGELGEQLQSFRVAGGLDLAAHIGDAICDEALFPKQQVIHRACKLRVLVPEAMDETEIGGEIAGHGVEKAQPFLLSHIREVVLELLEKVIEGVLKDWICLGVLSLATV